MLAVYIICYVEELIKMYLVYRHILGYPMWKSNKKNIIIAAGAVLIGIIGAVLFRDMGYDILLNGCVLLVFIYTLVAFAEKLWKKILIFLPVYVMVCMLDLMIKLVREILWKGEEGSFQELILTAVFNIVSILLICLISSFAIKTAENRKQFSFSLWLTAGVAVVVAALLMAYGAVILEEQNTLLNKVLSIGFGFAWLFFVCLLVIYMYTFSAKERYRIISETNATLLKSQKDYYRMLLKNDKSIRKFRHDYRNHMHVLHELIKQGKYQEGEVYLKQLDESLAKTSSYKTGNEVADIIVNDMAGRFSEDNIRLEIRGFLDGGKDGLSDFDICTIVSNALSNAFEATRKVSEEKRVIHMKLEVFRGRWLIELENPILENINIRIKDGNLETTKTDKSRHGYGVANMRECISKNNGTLHYEQKGESFFTRIIL